MALLQASQPSAQTCGGEDILHIFFLFPEYPEFSTPLQILLCAPPPALWLHPATRLRWRLQRGSALQSCWWLRSVHQRYRLFTGAQSPWEASPAQRIPSLSLEALKTPAAAASEPEPAKESGSQRLSLALSPYAGDGLQIARTFEGARPARPRALKEARGHNLSGLQSVCGIGGRPTERCCHALSFAGSGAPAGAGGVLCVPLPRPGLGCAALGSQGLWAPFRSEHRSVTDVSRQEGVENSS